MKFVVTDIGELSECKFSPKFRFRVKSQTLGHRTGHLRRPRQSRTHTHFRNSKPLFIDIAISTRQNQHSHYKSCLRRLHRRLPLPAAAAAAAAAAAPTF